MLPLETSASTPPGAKAMPEAAAWDFGATPSVGLALRAEALVLSSCRLWCPPRPWSTLRGSGKGGDGGVSAATASSETRGKGGTFLHRVSAHALACPANHASGVRLLAALLPLETPTPLHRLTVPEAMAAAAAAGMADAGGEAGGGRRSSGSGPGLGSSAGGNLSSVGVGRLVGMVHTAAALERSEGLRRQAVASLERRVGEVRAEWDLCIAGDLFPRGGAGSVKHEGGDGEGDGDNHTAAEDDEGWRPALLTNPLLAVTALELVNVPAVVVSLCHAASPVLQARVVELAKRWVLRCSVTSHGILASCRVCASCLERGV